MPLPLQLLKFDEIIEGLRNFVQAKEAPYSMRQNLEAMVETPVLEDGTDLWRRTQLDSKDMQLYGGKNEDDRYRFKIDSDCDLLPALKCGASCKVC